MSSGLRLSWRVMVRLYQGAVGLGVLTWAAAGTALHLVGLPVTGPALTGAFVVGALVGLGCAARG